MPLAADLFGDVDLVLKAITRKVEDYPAGVLSETKHFPNAPWMYTGAMENYPEVIDPLSRERRLLGNDTSVLSGVRNPAHVATVLTDRSLPSPEVFTPDDLRPVRGDWLCKPLKSSGGLRITKCEWNSASDPRPGIVDGCYFQEFVEGVSHGAVFVGDTKRAVLLGVTQQFTDLDWLGSQGVVYQGSFGPVELPDSSMAQLQQIGSCLAERFGLVGLFGIDFVLQGDEVWTVEVNPRYTATVEILEQALALNAITMHVQACTEGVLGAPRPQKSAPTQIGKVIKCAAEDLIVTPQAVEFAVDFNRNRTWPTYADIPFPDSHIRAGQPIASVLATGKSQQELEHKLRRAWNAFQQRLE